MGKRRPLSPAHALAAERLGLGWTVKRVAQEAGVSTKTVQRWQRRADVRALVERSRGRVLEENPSPTAVLTAALSATKKDGSPDWNLRVVAARALLGRAPDGEGPEERVRETRIFVGAESPER